MYEKSDVLLFNPLGDVVLSRLIHLSSWRLSFPIEPCTLSSTEIWMLFSKPILSFRIGNFWAIGVILKFYGVWQLAKMKERRFFEKYQIIIGRLLDLNF